MFVDPGLSLWITAKMKKSAAKAKPRFEHGIWYFPGGWPLKAMMITGGLMFPAIGILGWETKLPLWQVLAMVPLSILPWIAYPPVLMLSDLGVEQHRWWGQPKIIHWSEITELAYDPRDGTFQVTGANRLHIQHTGLNVAQPIFVRMVLDRTHLPIVHKSLLLNFRRKPKQQAT